ncbi:hypothetical protein [Candidatus Entotheonella palauensis]|uniref:hypothetical protein n=1 Tax=Candidatus Entotheonella palauensis TaxID=93172 RepID=UPI0011789415|nr:hypothetical protein [Candidatus Entotheonella palauensis]
MCSFWTREIDGIVLGVILGKLGEQNFAQAMQRVTYDYLAFLTRPFVATLLAAAVLTLCGSLIRAFTGRSRRA